MNVTMIAHIGKRGALRLKTLLTTAAILPIVAVLVWQAVTAHGNPDPTTHGLSPLAVVMSTAVLVFREGLEAILVLATITAGVSRVNRQDYMRAVPMGAGAAFIASVATWFAVVAIISRVNAPELDIQAATGLLAIVVLLVVMNWFFHKVYWTGWIAHHVSGAGDCWTRTQQDHALFGVLRCSVSRRYTGKGSRSSSFCKTCDSGPEKRWYSKEPSSVCA